MNDQEKARIIIAEVCAYQKVNIDEVVNSRKFKLPVETRHLCWYFIRKKTGMSLSTMAFMLGRNTHAAPIHGARTIENRIRFNGMKSTVDELKIKINAAISKADPMNALLLLRQKRVKNHRIAVRRKIRKMYKSA